MKKFSAIVILMLSLTASLSAQSKYGIVAGVTSSQANISDVSKGSLAGYSAGIVAKRPLFLGLGIQSALLYNMKGAKISEITTTKGYIELPVQLQCGVDLVFLRPFVFVEPFVGYAVNTKTKTNGQTIRLDLPSIEETSQPVNSFAENLEYGLSLGGGIEIGTHFQLALKYFRNLDDADISAAFEDLKQSIKGRERFDGFQFTAAFLF